MTLSYMPGFGNDFETESAARRAAAGPELAAAPAYGLYAEQLSGSPFTAPRGTNERSWLYRIRPSVRHTGRFHDADYPVLEERARMSTITTGARPAALEPDADARRSRPISCTGMRTMTTAGDVFGQAGMAAHVYVANRSMVDDHFFDADGELLIVPQQGGLASSPRWASSMSSRARSASCRAAWCSRSSSSTADRARLCLRELRRQVHAARPRPDRRQLPRQSARLQDAGRRLRGQGDALPAARQMVRRASTSPRSAIRRSTSSPGTATMRPTNTTLRPFRRSARSCSTIPTRRSSRC